MRRYAIDAPTLLHLITEGVEVNPQHQLVAPNRVRSEALELLLGEVLRGDRDEQAALDGHERMTRVRIRALGDRVSRAVAWRLAREHGWHDLRDAEYLAVTTLQADALVTVDDALARRAAGIVPVAPVSALTG